MKLSILIPSLNEEWLQNTIDDILLHSEVDTEIIVGLDGWKTEIKEHPKVKVLELKNSIGQRAMTNRLARIAKGEYLMKCDAHVSFAQGFDKVILRDMEKDMVMTPMLCRLDAKNWQIVAKPFTKKYYFDTNLVFQYYKSEEDTEWGLVETMALQGSCFMVSKENYWKWNLCDEKYGSWGFQGAETACKTWFNGGRVVTNTNTFYGHLFRGLGQNVTEIPYERKKEDIEIARRNALELLQHPKMPWLVEKFNFPGDWKQYKFMV